MKQSQVRSVLYVIAGALVLWAMQCAGDNFYGTWVLDLGSIVFPTPRHTVFLAFWLFSGSIAAYFFARGLVELFKQPMFNTLQGSLEKGRDRTWITVGMILALAFPLFVRFFILEGAPVVDDESRYRFGAELLLSGRLYSESHPMKLFFDSTFMINDGKVYSQYPLGWSALMIPELLFLPHSTINAFYNAMIIPPLFWSTRILSNRSCARLAIVFFLVSPFLSVSAATSMAHTSCLSALTWMLFFALKSTEPESRTLWYSAGTAIAFSVAFFIRPLTAVGIGIPVILFWAIRNIRQCRNQLVSRSIAFIIPAFLLASLFLLINHLQTGSMWTLAYERVVDYSTENEFRFSHLAKAPEKQAYLFSFADISTSLGSTLAALFRFNFSSLGWPISFFFMFWAAGKYKTSLPWWIFWGYILSHLWVPSAGVDTFGPVHYIEMVLPVIILSAIGAVRFKEWLNRHFSMDNMQASRWLMAVVIAFILASQITYVPVKTNALLNIAADVNEPYQALERQKIKNAVIFAARPFSRTCKGWPSRGFVYWRPVNDPDYSNDIIWANHLTVEEDKKLMRHFEGKTPYMMVHDKKCFVHYVPFDRLPPDFPPGVIGGSNRIPQH